MKIHCQIHEGGEIQVDEKLKAWPCCYYDSANNEGHGKTGDEYIDSLPEDWNSLNTNTLEEILKHEAFTTHFNDEHWNDSKKCSPLCKKFCSEEFENFKPIFLKDEGPTMARCNENISDSLEPEDIDKMQRRVEQHFQKVLEALRIDTESDHNTKETAKRVAKMFVREIFAGRYEPKPVITSFPNINHYDELYVTGPIRIRSTCAHHFQPIVGNAWIGIKPAKNVIGLSKFNRLVDWIASRPQIQEEMTVQIADVIQDETNADSVALIIKAEHMCLTHRGVKEHESDMTTSVMRGEFREFPHIKQEFLSLLTGMKGIGN